MRARNGFFLLSLLLIGSHATAAAIAVSLQSVASGLSSPVYATHAPRDPNRLFVVEQGGAIKIVDLNTNTVLGTNFLSISGLAGGNEQGLLGLAFHPNYQSNGYFYVNLTNTSGTTEIRRYQVQGDPKTSNLANSTSQPVLSYSQPQANHNGGWMGFDQNGLLYISSGDGGGSNDNFVVGHTAGTGNAQDTTDNLLGKMLRINVDGDDFPGDANRNYSNPAGNPFFGVTGDDEIWSYGLRNPWRASFDRVTGDMYIGDVGQGAREEIDFEEAARTQVSNFGWRLREGLIQTPASGIGGAKPANNVDPVYDYPNPGGGPAAVTGGYVYRGPVAELDGLYFFADFFVADLWTLDTTDNFNFANVSPTIDPGGLASLITSFGEDLYSNLYIVSRSGSIFRVTGDVPHTTEGDPFLPDSIVGGVFGFDDAPGDGRWFDPAAADGYTFQTDGSSNFIQVGLPSLTTVPDSDGLYTISSLDGTLQVAAGAFHSFSSGVTQFTITGIDPTVDGTNPLAFPTFLAFDDFANDFTMTPLLANANATIPEPGTASALVLGSLLLLFAGHRRRLDRRRLDGPSRTC